MTIKAYNQHSPILGNRVYIDDSACLTGEIQIGEDSSIWPLVAARGDVNTITIGQRTNVQDGTVLHVTRKTQGNPDGHPLIIGDDVTVGHKCMLHGCELGNRILVGMGAIIMDGARVQDDVFIGAGALVPPNKVLESGYLYVGSPVKKARPLNKDEQDFLATSAVNYVLLKNEYLEAQAPFNCADIYDEHAGVLQIAEPLFKNYGGQTAFQGKIVTVKCFEDNSQVKTLVATPGQGQVLVVDGGASLHHALLGDLLAQQATDNGWNGFIINGCVRDVDALANMPLGIKALAAVPAKTEKKGAGEINPILRFAGIHFQPGDYLYADNNGVVVTPKALSLS